MNASPPTVTADLCAASIVAAARAYGDDPVQALTARIGLQRRSLVPAAEAIAVVTETGVTRIARLLKVSRTSFMRAKARRAADYASALSAAVDAARAVASTMESAPEPPAAPPEPLPPAPPAAEPTRKLAPGPVTSWIAPTPGLPSLPAAERPLTDRILEVLADGSATPMGLASILGVKESFIGQSLSVLRHAGLISADPPPPQGSRQQRHRLVSTDAARMMVIEAFVGEPMTGPELMEVTGLGEGEVRAALHALDDAGLLVASARTQEGWSVQSWRRPAGEQAA